MEQHLFEGTSPQTAKGFDLSLLQFVFLSAQPSQSSIFLREAYYPLGLGGAAPSPYD